MALNLLLLCRIFRCSSLIVSPQVSAVKYSPLFLRLRPTQKLYAVSKTDMFPIRRSAGMDVLLPDAQEDILITILQRVYDVRVGFSRKYFLCLGVSERGLDLFHCSFILWGTLRRIASSMPTL